MDEKWLYELAELYHKGGMGDQCVRTCDKIMLLFGLGKYVEKAMDLKLEYEPLNKYQMDLVENRDKYEAKLRAVEEEFAGNPSYQDDYEDGREAAKLEEPSYDVEKEVVMRLHEDAQTQKLAREMSKLSDTAAHTVEVEEDDMDATRTLDDLRSIKEIRPTRRVLDVEAERREKSSARESSGREWLSALPRPGRRWRKRLCAVLKRSGSWPAERKRSAAPESRRRSTESGPCAAACAPSVRKRKRTTATAWNWNLWTRVLT